MDGYVDTQTDRGSVGGTAHRHIPKGKVQAFSSANYQCYLYLCSALEQPAPKRVGVSFPFPGHPHDWHNCTMTSCLPHADTNPEIPGAQSLRAAQQSQHCRVIFGPQLRYTCWSMVALHTVVTVQETRFGSNHVYGKADYEQ